MLTTNWSQLQQLDGNNGTLRARPYNQNKSRREEMAIWLLHMPDALKCSLHKISERVTDSAWWEKTWKFIMSYGPREPQAQ